MNVRVHGLELGQRQAGVPAKCREAAIEVGVSKPAGPVSQAVLHERFRLRFVQPRQQLFDEQRPLMFDRFKIQGGFEVQSTKERPDGFVVGFGRRGSEGGREEADVFRKRSRPFAVGVHLVVEGQEARVEDRFFSLSQSA
ncbi:MAG: hypothetical protein ACT4O3_09070 [Elusimicrobiota bacterium]